MLKLTEGKNLLQKYNFKCCKIFKTMRFKVNFGE